MNTLAVFHSCACTDGEKKRKSTIFPIYPITDGCKMHLNLKKKKKNQRGGANYLKGKRTERNLRIGRGWRASSEDWRVICACESVLGHGFSCRIVFSFARACVRACMRACVRVFVRDCGSVPAPEVTRGIESEILECEKERELPRMICVMESWEARIFSNRKRTIITRTRTTRTRTTRNMVSGK